MINKITYRIFHGVVSTKWIKDTKRHEKRG
jgi:phenolic acid decarboxylase